VRSAKPPAGLPEAHIAMSADRRSTVRHPGPSADCLTCCVLRERLATRDKPTVTLSEARARMGRTFGVDPNYWTWSVDDIRWIMREWKRGWPEIAEGKAWLDATLGCVR